VTKYRRRRTPDEVLHDCPECSGEGKIDGEACEHCEGEGEATCKECHEDGTCEAHTDDRDPPDWN
jgi:hypothetical protein